MRSFSHLLSPLFPTASTSATCVSLSASFPSSSPSHSVPARQQILALSEISTASTVLPVAPTAFVPRTLDMDASNDPLSRVLAAINELRNDFAAVRNDTSAIRQDLATLTATVQQNTIACNELRADVAYLKHSYALARPTAELIVNGIPNRCSMSYQDIILRVLNHLKLPALFNDVLSIQKIDYNTPSSSYSTAVLQTSIVHYFAIKVLFKSVEVRNFIVEAKRKLGKITVQELFPELSDESNADKIVYVNEFLPSSTYKLLKKAKTATRGAGFKRVWARNGNVFVRKDGGVEELLIATEQDLNKIV